jgi:hypothetical protein
MKTCGNCGRKNEDETVHCQECGAVFEGMMIPQGEFTAKVNDRSRRPKAIKIFVLLCGLLALGVLAKLVFAGSAVPGITLSFSGYSTNSAGTRVAIFSLVSRNQQATLYRAMSDPAWPSLLSPGRMPPLSPERFVQYGRLPPFARVQFEVPLPAEIPVDRRYRLTLAYCRDQGRFADQTHRFWRKWVLRWVPHKLEPFAPPGFGSHTIVSPDIAP